jgi:hypothetical protein
MDYHIIYTDKNGDVHGIYKPMNEFKKFEDVEQWLKSIGAKYWEIGFPDEVINTNPKWFKP